ncbi:AMP-binding protein [Ramlibacter sp. AW1]|uniref:AMP-binding protein n=1 Tax=Ramlibacter aurantiacus TaxID=2801330 RepID=A0A936ZQ92_9BURK|nr:AMP-binding protein [Ramlibacter aurantiacus]MBL0421473.1 AMP-binding protein [Ramlibacter aurantiacus]
MPDGTLLLANRQPLQPTAPSVLHWLQDAAQQAQARAFLMERAGTGWTCWTYGQAWAEVRRLSRALRTAGLQPGLPMVLLARNSISQARITLAAMLARIPVAPVNPRYAASVAGRERLRSMVATLRPQACWSDDPAAEDFLRACGVPQVPVLEATADGAVDETLALPEPDTQAKLYFTSGSTGSPKAVPYTQRMMTSNAQMVLQVWPFLRQQPLVMVDWLPWTHVFGGNNNINLVLRLAGTLVIDAGAPTAEGMSTTLANLAEVSPTFYCNVPAGYARLAGALEADEALRRQFFRRLDAMFFAAAAMPQPLFERLQVLARSQGRDIPVLTGWGATETGPSATLLQTPDGGPGQVGTPAPGVTLRLVPNGRKTEAWVRSPSVASGYWRAPEASRAQFDDEGFFRTGDALRLADPDQPAAGLLYDGRVAEDFKLQSGTWVNASAVRASLLACADGSIHDLVLVGPNRPWLGALAWMRDPLAPDAARQLEDAVARHNASAGGAAQRIVAAAVLPSGPDPEAGEINDKGYVNQARARDLRAAEADRLYARGPAA